LAPSTVCELGCDATIAVLVEDGEGNPLHLGDTTPTVSRRQKRALLARDKGCRFPGCGGRRYLHAHHIVHWIHGGPTCVSNVALLCGRHHRAVHRRGFGVTGSNGELTFTRPDDTIIQPAPQQVAQRFRGNGGLSYGSPSAMMLPPTLLHVPGEMFE
jgi:hypothetical protein